MSDQTQTQPDPAAGVGDPAQPAPAQTWPPPAQDPTPAPVDEAPAPAPVKVDSDPFVVTQVREDQLGTVVRAGIVIASREVDYELPAKSGEAPEQVNYTELTVAWFDGSISSVHPDDVERPTLS